MSEPSDQQLLSAWATRHDEAAFRSLLGRYAGFVYGATLRRVGDAGLAEEIAQDVFARLSQNAARLQGHPTIAGWLHRSAMLLALDRLRRRTRRTRTLERFTQMNEATSAPDPWQDTLPHLDEAMDHLGAAEREVLMLHFVERRTFPEMAIHLGSTTDAVRMRTTRALASLSRILAKKKAVIPAAVLAAGLSGTLAHAAPAALVTLTPAALAGLGKVSAVSVVVHALETMRMAKIAAGATVALALSLPLVWQQSQIAATGARLAALQSARAATPALTPSPTAQTPTGTTKDGGQSFDLKSLAEDALNADYLATRRIRKAVAPLDNNNLTGLIETAMHSGLMPEPRDKLLTSLLHELRTRDPALFLEWSMKVLASTVPAQAVRSDYAFTLRNDGEQGFRDWMGAHPSAAATWAEANKEAWQQFGGGSLSTLTIAGLLQADPPRAYAMLAKSSVQECMATLFNARGSLKAEQTTGLAQWAASSIADVEKRRRLVRKALWFTPKENSNDESYLEMIRPKLLGLSLNDDDLTWVAARLALDSQETIEWNFKRAPTATISWLKNILPADRFVYAKGAFGHAYDPTVALTFLNAEFDKTPDDDLIAGYVESDDMRVHRDIMLKPSGGRHGETAFRLATRVQDPARRIALLVRAWRDLHSDSAEAAQEILAIPELAAGDRAAVEAQVASLLKK